MSDATVIAEVRLSHPELVLSQTIRAVPVMTTELEYQAIAAPGSYYLFSRSMAATSTSSTRPWRGTRPSLRAA